MAALQASGLRSDKLAEVACEAHFLRHRHESTDHGWCQEKREHHESAQATYYLNTQAELPLCKTGLAVDTCAAQERTRFQDAGRNTVQS